MAKPQHTAVPREEGVKQAPPVQQVLADVVTLEDEFRVTLVLEGDTVVIFVPRNVTGRNGEQSASRRPRGA